MTAYAIALLAVASAFLVPLTSMSMGQAYAETGEQDYDVDYGTYYSYTLQFVFDGKDAESIEWDFGDGSPVSHEWNPSHTYTEKGTYHVTQTTANSYNGGSTTVEVYRVTIAGFPVISFEENGGSQVEDIQQTAYRVVATEPPEPTRDGHTFDGWFTDPELTTPYDWSAEVTRSLTLHAGWTQVPTDPDTPVDPENPDDPVDPEDPDNPVDPDDPTGSTVTFDVDGGSVALDPVTVTDGSAVTLPAYTGTRDGYTFGGWMVGEVLHRPGETITVPADTTVEALWTPVGPDVGDDGDGGGSGSDDTGDDDTDGDGTDYLHLALVVLGAVCLVALVIGSRRR